MGAADTEVSICSNALRLVGEKPITALTDNTEAGRLSNAWYANVRDTCLQQHAWNFALARVELAALADAPAYQFDKQYQVPPDCLRVLALASQKDSSWTYPEDYHRDTVWRVEGGKILTYETTVYIKYIQRVTDPVLFPPLFVQAVQCGLAGAFAQAVTGKQQLFQNMQGLYNYYMQQAKTFDGMEGTPEYLVADELIEVRLSNTSPPKVGG